MRLKIILGSVLAIAILVVGCGGGGGDTSGGTSAGETGASTTTGKEATATNPGDKEGSGKSSEGSSSDGGGEGSGPSGSGESSKPLTKVEFSTRINEICIQVPPGYEAELKEAEKKAGKKLSRAETNLKAAVPPLYAAIEQMETVIPPAGEEQKLEDMITALEAAAKGVEEEPNSELSGPKSPFAEFQSVSRKYGFETCKGL